MQKRVSMFFLALTAALGSIPIVGWGLQAPTTTIPPAAAAAKPTVPTAPPAWTFEGDGQLVMFISENPQSPNSYTPVVQFTKAYDAEYVELTAFYTVAIPVDGKSLNLERSSIARGAFKQGVANPMEQMVLPSKPLSVHVKLLKTAADLDLGKKSK
jgi:hypothetical protein